MTQIAIIENRVENLEKQVRKYRRLTLCLGLLIIAVITMAQAPLYNEEIVATRIACEDLVIDGHIFISGDNPADIRVNLNKDGLFFTEMEVDGSASSVAVYSKTGVVLKDRVSIFSDPFSNGGSILIRTVLVLFRNDRGRALELTVVADQMDRIRATIRRLASGGEAEETDGEREWRLK